MKKLYILKNSNDSEDEWFRELKSLLQEEGIEAEILEAPISEEPKMKDWVKYLEEETKKVDEETFFVGYRVSCQVIIRFLEKLHKHRKIHGCIFVSPHFSSEGLRPEEIRHAHIWSIEDISFNRVLDHCSNFICIFDQEEIGKSEKDIEVLKEKLGSEIKSSKSDFKQEILNFIKK